jgi:hypothetical protein
MVFLFGEKALFFASIEWDAPVVSLRPLLA